LDRVRDSSKAEFFLFKYAMLHEMLAPFLKSLPEGGTKVTVYYTEEGGKKTAHYLSE
jgi:hypothetical protein